MVLRVTAGCGLQCAAADLEAVAAAGREDPVEFGPRLRVEGVAIALELVVGEADRLTRIVRCSATSLHIFLISC